MYLPVKEPYPPLWHLQEMLKKNELELFYMCTARLFQIHCGIHIDDLGGGQCRELYHLCGLVTVAPFYQVDFSGEHPWEYARRTQDLAMKRVAVTCVARIVREESARRMNVDRRELGKFSALYAAVILKGFREEHQATSEEKLRKAMEGRGKERVEGAPGGTCFWLGRPVHRGPGQEQEYETYYRGMAGRKIDPHSGEVFSRPYGGSAPVHPDGGIRRQGDQRTGGPDVGTCQGNGVSV